MNLIHVIIDRPLGSKHPDYDMMYELNYGYVEGIIAGDMKEQDAYVLGVDEAIKEFDGKLIAIINRKNDIEDKWVISNQEYSIQEIKKLTHFQEQFFDIEIIKVHNK